MIRELNLCDALQLRSDAESIEIHAKHALDLIERLPDGRTKRALHSWLGIIHSTSARMVKTCEEGRP